MNISEKLHAARDRISTLVKGGGEKLDPKPLVVHTGIRPPLTAEQKFKNMMLTHQKAMAESQLYVDETDFDDDEDIDMLSPFEKHALVFEMEAIEPPINLPAGETTVSGREEPSDTPPAKQDA